MIHPIQKLIVIKNKFPRTFDSCFYHFWTKFRFLIQSGGGPEDLQCILASCPLLFKSSDDKRMKNDNLFSVIFYGNHNLERRSYSSYPPRNTFSTLYDEVHSLRLWSFRKVLYHLNSWYFIVFIYRSSCNYIHTLIKPAYQYMYYYPQHYSFSKGLCQQIISFYAWHWHYNVSWWFLLPFFLLVFSDILLSAFC